MADKATSSQGAVVKEGSSITFQCPILSESNYPIWSLKIRAIFKAHGLWETIDPGTNVDSKKDNAAIAYLYQALPEDLILQVASCETAKSIWDSIKTRHLGVERVMEARLQSLKTEFDQIKMSDGEKVDEFVAKLSGIASKSATLGSVIEESALVRKLLTSMPDNFLNMVATIEQLVDLSTVKFQEVVGRLKAYEERVGSKSTKSGSSQLLLSYEEWETKKKQERYTGRGRGSNARGRGQGHGRSSDNEHGGHQPPNDKREPEQDNNERRDKRRIRCYNCNKLGHHGDDCRTIRCHNCDKLGHYAAECWNKRKPDETKGEALLTADDGPALLMAQCLETEVLNENSVFLKTYTKEENGESIWYLDNGASNHMTGNRSHFYELDEKINGKVCFGDNSTIDIKGKGSILLRCKNGEQRLLTNVYYIPLLFNNILSLGQFTEEGRRVLMEDNELKVYERSGRLLLKVERTPNRLYEIKLQTLSSRCSPNKIKEKIVTNDVDKSDLFPAAPHEHNVSQLEGQEVDQMTVGSGSENQLVTAPVHCVLEAENKPKSSNFGAAGGAPKTGTLLPKFPANNGKISAEKIPQLVAVKSTQKKKRKKIAKSSKNKHKLDDADFAKVTTECGKLKFSDSRLGG